MLVKASLRKLRTSPTKANQVAKMVRGMKALHAIEVLKYSSKRISVDIRKLIMSAVANAENNFGLDIDMLDVTELYVGKSMSLKRMQPRAKGRGNFIMKQYSNVFVVLSDGKGEVA